MSSVQRLDPITVLLWFALLAFGWVMISSATMVGQNGAPMGCLLYTSPSPRDATLSRMPSSA